MHGYKFLINCAIKDDDTFSIGSNKIILSLYCKNCLGIIFFYHLNKEHKIFYD